jgi:O-antigen/teichoic acid export membrane protein
MAGRVKISKRLVLINSSSSLGANLISISVLVWLQQYLIKHIPAEEYAMYPLLMAVMLFMPLLSTLMIGGVGRFVTEAFAQGDERRAAQIVSTLTPPLVGAAGLLLVGGGVFAWNVNLFLEVSNQLLPHARLMMGLLVLSAVIRLVTTPYSIGLFIRQRFVTINVLALLAQVLRLLLLFILLFGVSKHVLWVVVATVTANVSQVLATLVLSRRALPSLRFDRSLINYSTIGQVASFNAWIFVAHFSNMIKQAADPWILHKFATDVDVWCMHLGAQAYDRVDNCSVVAAQTAQPALTALHATGDTRRLGMAYLRGCRYALWLACFVAVPIIIFAHELIALYLGAKYEEFSAAATVLILIFSTFPIWYTTLLLSRIAEATARIRLFTVYAVLMNAANLGISLYLVAGLGYGAEGAAAARLIGGLIFWPFVVMLGLSLAQVSFRQWLFEAVCLGWLPCATGAIAWLLLKFTVSQTTWLQLGGSVAVGCVVYAVTVLICLRPDERRDLRRLLSRFGLAKPLAQRDS